eukprot:11306888-Alexandrium_andersonii.AAC.1
MVLHLYTDGSFTAAAGEALPQCSWAFVALGERQKNQFVVLGAAAGHISQEAASRVGAQHLSNNVAELVALLHALAFARAACST